MIVQIEKKQYDQIQRVRKIWPATAQQVLTWKGPDGKYYKSDEVGMMGVKAMVAFNKNIKISLDSQETLL